MSLLFSTKKSDSFFLIEEFSYRFNLVALTIFFFIFIVEDVNFSAVKSPKKITYRKWKKKFMLVLQIFNCICELFNVCNIIESFSFWLILCLSFNYLTCGGSPLAFVADNVVILFLQISSNNKIHHFNDDSISLPAFL